MSIGKPRAGPDSLLVKHRFCVGEEKAPGRKFPHAARRWANFAASGNSCRVGGGKYFQLSSKAKGVGRAKAGKIMAHAGTGKHEQV